MTERPLNPFEAWAVPPGVEMPPPGGGFGRVGDAGVGTLEPTPAWLGELTEVLRSARTALQARPARELADVLGRVGARFLDDGDPLRARALEALPRTSGLSPPMAQAVLDGMAYDWTGERLAELLEDEFGSPAILDGFVPSAGGRVRGVGAGLCVQIVSGSVPGVGATALLRSLLVKSPTLVKPGRGDEVLPVLMARGIVQEDPTLADALAVVYWPGGNEELEGAVLSSADVVVAYGGDEAVRSVRDRTPVTARFVAYPHRVSIGVVGRAALEPDTVHQTASEVAGAAAFFDQRGCVSPQVVYVEEGGALAPDAFAREVATAMGAVEASLPGGVLDGDEAAAIQQARATAELLAATGSEIEVHHGGAASWTVLLDTRDAMTPQCVGRLLRLVPVPDAAMVPVRAANLGPRLQTVGVAGLDEARLLALAEELSAMGACRITPFSGVPFPPPWWHHDGQGPLRELVRWSDLES